MRIKYSVSLWNYFHYADVPSLERIIMLLREQNYGIELWPSWKEEKDLFDEIGRKRLKYLLEGMEVTLHTGEGNTFDLHQKQIDAAVDFGAEVIVLHSSNLVSRNNSNLDMQLTSRVVAYAGERGVKLALENGKLSVLASTIERVEGLGICLDVGHVYFTSDPMSKFLDVLKERIIHLHLQDILPKTDHYMLGTGGIPHKDWQLLATTLKEINFQGTAVFEIQPRNPLQTALLGMDFMRELLED